MIVLKLVARRQTPLWPPAVRLIEASPAPLLHYNLFIHTLLGAGWGGVNLVTWSYFTFID